MRIPYGTLYGGAELEPGVFHGTSFEPGPFLPEHPAPVLADRVTDEWVDDRPEEVWLGPGLDRGDQ